MIFISTGSRKFQFDRLIKKMDELVAEGRVKENVFAQIAETQYLPQHFSYSRYLNSIEFAAHQESADLIITHAGTGALVGALKKGKQVIAVPRLAEYGEHSDDHQIQIAEALESEGYLRVVLDIDQLADTIHECFENPILKKYDKPSNVIPIIERQIAEWFDFE